MKANRHIVLLVFLWFAFFATVARAHPASGIVVDHQGNIYFSDLETIWKLNANNELSVFRAGVSGRHVHELAIDDHDNIYGADLSYESQKFISDIWKMTPDGKFEYLLKPTDDPPRAMSIWRDGEGNNYWIDQNNHTRIQTLLLRRAPDGTVTTLAGSAYGHADGKGSAARFSSVGGLAFGPDGSFYLADGASVRKVTRDGTVTTLAGNLDARTKEDKSTALVGSYGNLAGLAVDSGNNVYVADAGNRRLLKITRDGKTEVLLRTDPPFFPNGVSTSAAGDVYVLEVGFTLPSTSSGPRVRKLGVDGKQTVLAVIGETKVVTPDASKAGSAVFTKTTLIKLRSLKLGAAIFGTLLLGSLVILWSRRRRQQT